MAIPSESGTVSSKMAKSLLQGMVGLERLQQRHSPLVFQVSYTDPINPGLNVDCRAICQWSFPRDLLPRTPLLAQSPTNILYVHR